MLLLVFLIATVNLAVGYAWGAGIRPAALLRLRRRRRVVEEAETPLTAAPIATSATTPVTPTASSPAPQSAPKDVMAGLASLRAKLATASLELRLNQEDEKKFSASASRLQEVSGEYVENAQQVAARLGELGATGDSTAAAAGACVARGAEEAAVIHQRFGVLLEGEMTDEARAELLEQAEAIKQTASETQVAGEKAVAEAPATAAAPAAPVAVAAPPLSHPSAVDPEALFDRLESLLTEATGERPLFVATLTPDPIDGQAPNSTVHERLIEQLDALVAEALGEDQLFSKGRDAATGGPTLILSGDSFVDAVRRVDTLRQTIEAATFRWNAETFRITVTCGLAEARPGDARDAIEKQLVQAIAEGDRSGRNRTFHHDGAFATALPAIEGAATPERVVTLRP